MDWSEGEDPGNKSFRAESESEGRFPLSEGNGRRPKRVGIAAHREQAQRDPEVRRIGA